MSDDTIRAALIEARAHPTTAGKIIAFLRALPDVVESVPWPSNSDGLLHTRQSYFAGDLARKVEEAARHD